MTHRCQGCGAMLAELMPDATHHYINHGYAETEDRRLVRCGPVVPWPSQEQELLLRCWEERGRGWPTDLERYLRAAGLIDEKGERIK